MGEMLYYSMPTLVDRCFSTGNASPFAGLGKCPTLAEKTRPNINMLAAFIP